MVTTAELVAQQEERTGNVAALASRKETTASPATAPLPLTPEQQAARSREEGLRAQRAELEARRAVLEKERSELSISRFTAGLIVGSEEYNKAAALGRNYVNNRRESLDADIGRVNTRITAVNDALVQGVSYASALKREKSKQARADVPTIVKRAYEASKGDEEAAAILQAKLRSRAKGTFYTRKIPKYTGETTGKTSGLYISPLTGKTVVVREGGATTLPQVAAAKFTTRRDPQTFRRPLTVVATIKESEARREAFNEIKQPEPPTINGDFVSISGGTAKLTTKAERDFYERVSGTKEREEKFLSIFDPAKSVGAERLRRTARFLTFGDAGPQAVLPRKTSAGRVAENVVLGALSWPVALGGAIPLATEKLLATGEALIKLEPESVGKEALYSAKEVEKSSFSFLPGGTPIAEEGAETVITAALFALPGAAVKTLKTKSNVPIRVKAGDFVVKTKVAEAPKNPFVRVEKTPDPTMQLRLGKTQPAETPAVSTRPAESFGVVLKVPEKGVSSGSIIPRFVFVRETPKPKTPFLRIESTGPKEPLVEVVTISEPRQPFVTIESTGKRSPLLRVEDTSPKKPLVEVIRIDEVKPKTPFLRIESTGPKEPLVEVVTISEPRQPLFEKTIKPRELVVKVPSFLSRFFKEKPVARGQEIPKTEPAKKTTPKIDEVEVKTGEGTKTIQKIKPPTQETEFRSPIKERRLIPVTVEQTTETKTKVIERAPELKESLGPTKTFGVFTTMTGTKTFVDAISRTKPLSRTNLISDADIARRAKTDVSLDVKQIQSQTLIEDVVQLPEQATDVVQAVNPAVLQSSRLRQDQEQKTKKRLLPIIPPPTIKRKKTKPSAVFELQVRRRGEFRTVAKGLQFEEAVKRGGTITGTTAAASFRVKGSKAPVRALSLLGARFRPSKRSPDVFVERRQFRISSPGEVAEISRAPKSRSKRIIKKKKGLFERIL